LIEACNSSFDNAKASFASDKTSDFVPTSSSQSSSPFFTKVPLRIG
jgi:hypothetical protein